MEVKKYKLADLKKAERNVRDHPEAQIREYIRSLKKFGQAKPIIIDENNVIIAGNGMYDALKRMDVTDAWCIKRTDLSEKDKLRFMAADNRIFSLGSDNLEAFDALLAELGGEYDIPGYSDELLESLLMDSSGTTELLSEYGKLDEEDAERIRASGMKYEMPEASAKTETADFPIPSNDNIPVIKGREESTEASGKNYVICPKCGEKIWL